MVVSPSKLTVAELRSKLSGKSTKGITTFDKKGLVSLYYRTHSGRKSPRRSPRKCTKYSPKRCKSMYKSGAKKGTCRVYHRRHCVSPARRSPKKRRSPRKSPKKTRRSPRKSPRKTRRSPKAAIKAVKAIVARA